MKSPLNITWKSEIISVITVVATIVTSIISYRYLPEKVISHWNLYGQADGWTSRSFHVIFFPTLIGFMYLLFLVLPNIDPKKERYQEFATVYNIFRSMILSVLFVIYLIATLVNLGYDINVGKLVPLIIGLMFVVMGRYMDRIKNNWFVGIRTPWTLSSENVWQKTHRLGGWMFVIFGVVLIFTPWMPEKVAMFAFIACIISVILVPLVASYVFYAKEKKENK